MANRQQIETIVVGAGCAGSFAAIRKASAGNPGDVTLIEAESCILPILDRLASRPIVTADEYDPAALSEAFCRGAIELRGPLHHFGPAEIIQWFEARGVELEFDSDGSVKVSKRELLRSCLEDALIDSGVRVLKGTKLIGADAASGGNRFWLTLEDQTTLECKQLILACGDLSTSRARAILSEFGHTIIDPFPSIASLQTRDPRLVGLAGAVLEKVEVGIAGTDSTAVGRVDFMPWGVAGPAIHELTSREAPRLRKLKYRFILSVNWIAFQPGGAFAEVIRRQKSRHVREDPQFGLPEVLWRRLTDAAGIPEDCRWQKLDRVQSAALRKELTRCEIEISKRMAWNGEHAICGGCALDEIDSRRFESRIVPGLHVIGQSLDIDAIAGGYNRQLSWTSAFMATQ